MQADFYFTDILFNLKTTYWDNAAVSSSNDKV